MGLPYFSLMEKPWGLLLGTETRREEALPPPNHGEAQETATQHSSLEDLFGKPGSSFLIYYYACENGSTLQAAQGLDEAVLSRAGVRPAAVKVLLKGEPCFIIQCHHTLPLSFRPMLIFAE